MIRLDRDRLSIPPGFRGATLRRRRLDLLTRHLNGDDANADVWKGAKDQLKVESHGKCAYCEADTSVVAYGDVEHFRPKSVYWWLAYCYDNYTYSCQICNQAFKSATFPVSGQALPEPVVPASATASDLAVIADLLSPDPTDAPAVQAFLAANVAESADLPDPYAIDPEQFFVWFADDALGEVEIRPRPGTAGSTRIHGAVVGALGLNREELRRLRYRVYSEARVLAQVVVAPNVDAALASAATALLQTKLDGSSQFAAVARYVVRDIAGLPI